MANKSKACKCSILSPETVWYKLNCNDLKLTSANNSVIITKGETCAYDFSVQFPSSNVLADNGLTKTLGTIILGGNLNQFTDINNSGNIFALHGTGDNIIRTANGTFQSNISSSSIAGSITANDSSSNLFSELNAGAGVSSMVGGNNTTFYNTLSVTPTYIRAEVNTNTSPLYIQLDTSGQLRANAYGAGIFTGTPAYSLQVDSSGNVIEVAIGGGGQRFGVSGEDALATQNRFFDLGSSHIMAISGSGTSFIVNQILGTASAIASIAITNGSVQTQVVDSTGTQISSISLDPIGIQFGSTTGKYFFSNIPEYIDNAAAISGGLIPGGMYRTGDILKIAHS